MSKKRTDIDELVTQYQSAGIRQGIPQPVWIIGGTLLVGAVGYWAARKFLSNRAERASLKEGSPESIAKLLKMAFENDLAFGMGTNEEQVRSALRSIKSQAQWRKVQLKYKQMYHRELNDALKDELSSSELMEMLFILAAKPEKEGGALPANIYDAWAGRFYAAFLKVNGFISSPDEAAIKAVALELPTQKALILSGVAYQKKYGGRLMEDLKKKLSSSAYYDFLRIIIAKPK
jgi:hypothetical protein